MKSETQNYWVVGANWDGDNHEDAFCRGGYWEMGYADAEKPEFTERRDSIKHGDRIAIKSRDGHGADTISIKAIGIVKKIIEGKVYVEWVLTKMDRHVPCKNYLGTIHGPVEDINWMNEAFRL